MNELKITFIRTVLFLAPWALVADTVHAAGQAVSDGDVIRAEISPAKPLSDPGDESVVAGKVVGKSLPVAQATVYAYEVANYALKKVLTDGRGRFLLGSLPAGMYKIIAYKDGFSPTVELLLRRRQDDSQYLEIEMTDEATGDVRQAEDYWTVRGRVPPDVLRDIQHLWQDRRPELVPGLQVSGLSGLAGEMIAKGGFEQLGVAQGEASLSGAEFDLHGQVGQTQIGLNGQYRLLTPTKVSGQTQMPETEVRSVAVSVEGKGDSKLQVASSTGQLATLKEGQVTPVDLAHYQLQWSGSMGDRGRSEVTAQYTEEANFYRAGWVDPIEAPAASRTWNLEGSYSSKLTDRTSLQAGANYRQRLGEGIYYATLTGVPSVGSGLMDQETLGVFGIAGSRIVPRVMVEYGLYSSVQDGSLSLMPSGGIVVDLGSNWTARTSVARRLDREDESDPRSRFNVASFSDSTVCQDVAEACYEVLFQRETTGQEESISVGAVHREYAETLRLYFNPDVFNRLESLFVVQGDEVPEVQFSMVRRIAPKVLAKLESNIAAGGGGIFYATDELPYENQVRYLVTSLDTRFQQTSTGLFVAFHHLEQELSPMSDQPSLSATEVEMQRLQLMLTQDLDALADFASNWSVRFNVELSRGATPYSLSADDELRKKLTGGISVSF